jgi:hypothetical protein
MRLNTNVKTLIQISVIVFTVVSPVMGGTIFVDANEIGLQQTKTGPLPPPGVAEKVQEKAAVLTEVTLLTVPGYSWRHGCAPTAVGMAIGYYDGLDYDELIPGDASGQTTAVNQAIASGGDSSNPNPPGSEQHYEDYSRPEDPLPGSIQTDDYISNGRSPHLNNCIADYMDTSKSTRDLHYGQSWFSDVGPAFTSYVNQQHYGASCQVHVMEEGGSLTWALLTKEIDNGRPMAFYVDTDADGSGDHLVTVVGYRDTPSLQYGCLDTWPPADVVRWCDFQKVGSGQPWGIWGGWSFHMTPLCPPNAYNGNVVAEPDTPVSIILQATDQGPNPPGALIYIITSLPEHGFLSDPCNGTINDPCTPLINYGNEVIYTSVPGYNGPDSFTFIANDSGTPPQGGNSNIATISITVKYNEAPVALAGTLCAQIDPVTCTLVATDDGLPNPPGKLTYIITSLPSDGVLSDPGNGTIISVPYSLIGNGNQVVYTPDVSFDGSDSFEFKANDITLDSNIATISITSIYEGGDGSSGNPFQINAPAQMAQIGQHSEHWASHFILTADIDLSGYTGDEFHIIGDWSGWFRGSFDGDGHIISNFTYFFSSNGPYIGLFGRVLDDGEIKNLGVVDIVVTSQGDEVGGLVGCNRGTVSNCYATGTVTGVLDVGGLVGYNSQGTVSNCYVACSVSGRGSVGGLVGYNSQGTVSNCYATGTVTNTAWAVGGLIGYNWQGTISNCYAVGSVTGGDAAGGLIGSSYSGSVTASFWDVNTSGQSTSAGGTGKTTAQMQTQSTFADAGWDFVGETINGPNDIWRLCVDGVEYPKLWWEFTKGDFDCPDGVNFIDYAFFALAWRSDDTPTANWNPRCDMSEPPDGIIDELDLGVFADNWLRGIYVKFYDITLDSDPLWITEGEWAFGEPTGGGGTVYGNPDPTSGYTGANVYGVNLNGDYDTSAPSGPHYLTAGPFDCSLYHNVKLKFARWLNTDYPPYVSNKIEVSDNGTTWQVVWEQRDGQTITDNHWKIVEYDISSVAGNQSTVYIRWGYEINDEAYALSGWNIDDIQLLVGTD